MGRGEGQGAPVLKRTDRTTARLRPVVREGHPPKEIAGVLNVSEKSVEFHKHHIMETFNFKSNGDLVLFALKRGLISVNSDTYGLAA